MRLPEFLQHFRHLFDARRDVHAQGYPDRQTGKYRYHTVDAELTDAVLMQHLRGQEIIGTYAIDVDSTCRWAAFDFDGDKTEDVDAAFVAAYAAAAAQRRALLDAGLISYIERSRSGAGAHLWVFFDRPLPAATIRRALRPLLVSDDTFDRMFPVQDGLTESKPLGNLIALPFHGPSVALGHSVFLDEERNPIPPQQFVTQVHRNPWALVEDLAAKAKPQRHAGTPRVRGGDADGSEIAGTESYLGALKVVSPYGCTFLRHCVEKRVGLPEPLWYAGIQCATYYQQGRDFAHLMSAEDPRYDPNIVDAKYDQALGNPRIGCQWIHDNYPALACKSCPMKAPHHLASRSIMELVGAKNEPMRKAGKFDADLTRVQALQDGTIAPGALWGLAGLDAVSRARRSEFVAIGAMPSIGKTWLLVQLAYSLAKQGTVVYVFSAETAEISLRTRILAHVAGVDSRALGGERDYRLTSAEWERLYAASDELDGLPIFIDYTSLSADQVLQQVERTQFEHRLSFATPAVILFDYLQFGAKIQGESNDYDKVSRLSTEFKFTGKITASTMVAFSQVRRDKEGSDSPDMTWFKNTGRIESDADVGFIITGDRVVGEYAPRDIWIVKQREGLANMRLSYLLQQTTGRWEYKG